MPPRTAPSSARQALGLLAFVALMAGALGFTVLLTQVVGAEQGEPCVQGAFACRCAGFNDARCLMTTPEEGRCTRLCQSDSDCAADQICQQAQWVSGGGDGGRQEAVCQAGRPDRARGRPPALRVKAPPP